MTEVLSTDVKVDVALTLGSDGIYDFEIGDDGDMASTYGLDTNLLQNVYCEERATKDEMPNAQMRRGCIIDEATDIQGHQTGSKIWFHNQSRETSDTKNAIIDKIRRCLSHYVPDLASDIIVTGEMGSAGMEFTSKVVRKNGKIDKLYFRFFELTGI